MKRKRNIYDADDAAKSKRLHFSPEEQAARAEKKAEILAKSWKRQRLICQSSAAPGLTGNLIL